MFKKTDVELQQLGAMITVKEIKQQPELWKEAFDSYIEKKADINDFLEMVVKKHGRIRVIFTGAGTSAYVGDTVLPYLKEKVNEEVWDLQSVPTTHIVSNPYEYFKRDIPTLLVSFARSGNSPESIATVDLGKQIVKDFYQITITCAPDGKLAQAADDDSSNLLLLMPADSNDKGFAMTGSYTCMTLTALLMFDTTTDGEKETFVGHTISMGKDVIKREEEIREIVNLDFNRVIYLGSGSLAGLAREASLKLLELTAGKTATLFDSSMGFRHGPKSFVDDKSLIFVFISNNGYTRKYDLDILNEVHTDKITEHIWCLTTSEEALFEGNKFSFAGASGSMPDAYLALPYIMFAQTVAIMAAVKMRNKPDTPSASGTVNRVVKGVTIHEWR